MNQIEDRTGKHKLVNWRQLEWFQGELKEITKDQFEKLVNSVIKNGFRMPFKVWEEGTKKWILDGHQRFEVLKEVEKRGYKVPDLLKAEFVECKDKKEAAELVILFSSTYAKISEQGLYEFSHTHDLDYKDLEIKYDLPEFDFEHYSASYFEEPKLPEENQEVSFSNSRSTVDIFLDYLIETAVIRENQKEAIKKDFAIWAKNEQT